MGYVSGQPTWRSMWLVTEDPLKSFVYPLHLVLIPKENLTNGDEDGIAVIADENLPV